MISFDRDLVFVDVETLGLDREAPIWEFAAIRLGPGDTEPSQSPVVLQILHQPDHWLDTLPEAFAADYRARHDIQIAIPRAQAARIIHAATDGAIIAGSNPSFDTERLGLLLTAHGITPGWHYHPLDIPSMIAGQIARSAVQSGSDLGGDLGPVTVLWKSDQLSRRIGVDPGGFGRHTALGDVQWCLAQWQAMNAA